MAIPTNNLLIASCVIVGIALILVLFSWWRGTKSKDNGGQTTEPPYNNYDLFNSNVIEPNGTIRKPNMSELISIARYILSDGTSNIYGVYRENERLFINSNGTFNMLCKSNQDKKYVLPTEITYNTRTGEYNVTNAGHVVSNSYIIEAYPDKENYVKMIDENIEPSWGYNYFNFMYYDIVNTHPHYFYKVIDFKGTQMNILTCTDEETTLIDKHLKEGLFDIFKIYTEEQQIYLYDELQQRHIPIVYSTVELNGPIDNLLPHHKPYINVKQMLQLRTIPTRLIEDAATILCMDYRHWSVKFEFTIYNSTIVYPNFFVKDNKLFDKDQSDKQVFSSFTQTWVIVEKSDTFMQ